MTNKDDQILAEALKEFKKSMKEAQEKLEQDFQDLFNKARKDAEEKSRRNEESEIADLDKELAEL